MSKRDLLLALTPLPDHAEVLVQVLVPEPDPEGADHLETRLVEGTHTTLKGLVLEVSEREAKHVR